MTTEKDSTTINNNTAENDSELDITIQRVKHELKRLFVRRKDLILELGHAFEKKVANPESICEEIKNALREEIASKYISARDIERYCLEQWKHKTKPKTKRNLVGKGENDKLSFSAVTAKAAQKEAISVSSSGNASTATIEESCRDSVQPVLAGKGDGNHCGRCSQLEREVEGLKETPVSLRRSKEAEKTSTAHASVALTQRIKIPKEKHRDVMNAMRSSTRECYLELDGQGNIIAINSDNVGVSSEKTRVQCKVN